MVTAAPDAERAAAIAAALGGRIYDPERRAVQI